MKLFLPAFLILWTWLPLSDAALPVEITQTIERWMAAADPVVEDDWPVYQRENIIYTELILIYTISDYFDLPPIHNEYTKLIQIKFKINCKTIIIYIFTLFRHLINF